MISMKRVAIIGGGISGLAAAFALEERRRAGESVGYVIFEAGPRFGGVLQTEDGGRLRGRGRPRFLSDREALGG